MSINVLTVMGSEEIQGLKPDSMPRSTFETLVLGAYNRCKKKDVQTVGKRLRLSLLLYKPDK